jgi:hypothetical protein
MPAILPQVWQKINGWCLFCHWWHDLDRRMISDMNTVLLLLLAIALVVNAVYVINLIAHDGGTRPRGTPPRSHYGDGFEPRRAA